MKKFLTILSVLITCSELTQILAQGNSYISTSVWSSYSSGISESNKRYGNGNAIKHVGISIDALGFVQFGPVVNVDFGLTDNLVLNTHIRPSQLGILYWVINMEDGAFPDKLTGMGVGGGLKYFFGTRRSKPYLGAIIEYGWGHGQYDMDASDAWEFKDGYLYFALNGGFRFRFASGFFINTGAYLGAAIFTKNEWYYSNPYYDRYDPYERGDKVKPYGMIDLAMGVEF